MAEEESTTEEKNQMDLLSANEGDRMKHAINLELLSRMMAWGSIRYSETHSGAGVYTGNSNIQELNELVLKERALFGQRSKAHLTSKTPGEEYLLLLARWWDRSENANQYPGSARQVLELFHHHKFQPFEIRLTEKSHEACIRLMDALKDERSRVEVLWGSFYRSLEWLLDADNILAVVDPFRCFPSLKDPNCKPEKFGVGSGSIDLEIVEEILGRIENKGNAILHFWWPMASQKNEWKKLIGQCSRIACQLFQDWCNKAPTRRTFVMHHDQHNHASSLVGIGGGREVVEDLRSLNWRHTPLTPFIRRLYEK